MLPDTAKTKWSICLLRFAAALALALLIWNFVVGVTTIRMPRIYSEGPFGSHYEPHSRHFQGIEGYGRFRHDEFGYNNPDGTITAAEQGDAPAVVVIGDSFTESLQVQRHDNFCSRLEQKLQAERPTLRVVNLGISGRSMADVIDCSHSIVERLHPVQVVVQCRIDDFLDDATNATKSLYIRPTDGTFQIVSAPAKLQRLRQAKNRAISASPLLCRSYLRFRALEPSMNSLLPDSFANFSKTAPPSGPAIPISEKAAFDNAGSGELIDWVLARLTERLPAGRLTILYVDEVSITSDLITDPSDGVAERYLFERCLQMGIPIVRTRGAFLKLLRQDHQSPTGFANSSPGKGHLNSSGHRLIAELLARHFQELETAD